MKTRTAIDRSGLALGSRRDIQLLSRPRSCRRFSIRVCLPRRSRVEHKWLRLHIIITGRWRRILGALGRTVGTGRVHRAARHKDGFRILVIFVGSSSASSRGRDRSLVAGHPADGPFVYQLVRFGIATLDQEQRQSTDSGETKEDR